jgi:hypothetical protein
MPICGYGARCLAQCPERIAAEHLVGARTRQRYRQMVDDAARPGRHHDHLVGKIDGLGQAVGDEQDGLSGCRPDPQQFVAHGHPRLLVECGERLVHQQHRRILDQAARDRDALLHAAGKFVRMTPAKAVETDQLQRVLGLGAPLGFRDAAQGQREFNVLLRRQPWKQARLLEHDADAVRIGLRDGRVVDQDCSGGLLAQAGHHHQQGRLAAAARSHQHHETAGLHFKRNVRQRHHILLAGSEDLAYMADLDGAGARGGLERGYVRQWLHRVSTDRTNSLNVIAIAAIIITPASSCFI